MPSIQQESHARPVAQAAVLPEKVRVPSRFVRAALRHSIPRTGSLFERHFDEFDNEARLRPVNADRTLSFENTFTGQELELLFAALARAGDAEAAVFASQGEWISMASGKRCEAAPEYYQAVRSLQTMHQVLDKEGDRYILHAVPPVRLEQNADGNVHVHLAGVVRNHLNSFHLVPLAISSLLRAGGLRRVTSPHIKLYLYVLTRVLSRKPQYRLDLRRIYDHAGLATAMQNRNAARVRKQVQKGLDAMVRAGILINWEMLGGDHVQVEPSPFHFGRAFETRKKRTDDRLPAAAEA